MKPLLLKVRSDIDLLTSMIIEDRGTGAGPDIREIGKTPLEAGSSEVFDVITGHCHACSSSIAEQIGLTKMEVSVIGRWRDRKADGVSAKMLGQILDKIVNRLDYVDDKCTGDEERFVIEIE